VPGATTLLKFLRSLKTCDLCKGLFAAINADLAVRGLLPREGTLMDATLIAAPSSTTDREKKRGSETHQIRMGNQRYFGTKSPIGVDRDSKVVPAIVVMAAHDEQTREMTPHLTSSCNPGDAWMRPEACIKGSWFSFSCPIFSRAKTHRPTLILQPSTPWNSMIEFKLPAAQFL
jgi:hypothetical protein